jgi:hypothetical protein
LRVVLQRWFILSIARLLTYVCRDEFSRYLDAFGMIVLPAANLRTLDDILLAAAVEHT